MKRRTAALYIGMIMALLLTGCGKQPDNSQEDITENTEGETAENKEGEMTDTEDSTEKGMDFKRGRM